MKVIFRNTKRDRLLKSALIQSVAAWLILLAAISPLPAADDFLQVTGPCRLAFPGDHGPHPGFRTEWWYYTGNLTGADQRRYGFQLTFFRSRLKPPSARRQWPTPASPWRTDQVYLAHAAVTDVSAGRHLQAEKMARPVRSMAGAEKNGPKWKIHIGTWQTSIAQDMHQLNAHTESFTFSLDLAPIKPVVLHGSRGYSQKGHAPEQASCYYSFTRLKAQGTLSIENRRHEVTGTAWMDHEFSTAALQPGISGWDWFSLQLSDQTEIMVYLLRQADGSLNTASSGTYVQPSGKTLHLHADDFHIAPLDYWTSPHSGARYPVQWDVSVPRLQCRLTVKANLTDQEMRTPRSTNVTYWEGSVHISGTKSGKAIEGQGYVELTGYAKPFDASM